MDDSERQALSKIRMELIDRLPPEDLRGIDKHKLVASAFHRLVRLTKARKKQGDGAAWEAFFSAHVPRLADHGRTLWAFWRTSLLKDDAPGAGVVISERTPKPHGEMMDSGDVLVDLESLIEDYIRAIDSLVAACETDDALRATVLHNWGKTGWQVLDFSWPGGPPTPGTINTVSASASSSGTTLVVRPQPGPGSRGT